MNCVAKSMDDLSCELWSEIHLWQPPGQGITFAAGSCMAALALQEDENSPDFMLNVLDRMGIQTPPTRR